MGVRQLVELLGGTISVDSKFGGWTKFMFEFPLTVSLDDHKATSSKLADCSVLLVTNSDVEARYMIEVCKHFNVKYLHFADLRELEAGFGSQIKGESSACIIQEDLYDDSIYQNLSKRSKSVFITFGPKGIVDKGQNHYLSLTRVFPSVIMQELGSMLDYAKISKRLKPNRLKEKPKASFEGLTVLLAEDNRVNQKVMIRMLERLGVTDVTLADNGKIATELSANRLFDVIFMTAHTPEDFETMCRDNGAEDFVSKPCTIG